MRAIDETFMSSLNRIIGLKGGKGRVIHS